MARRHDVIMLLELDMWATVSVSLQWDAPQVVPRKTKHHVRVLWLAWLEEPRRMQRLSASWPVVQHTAQAIGIGHARAVQPAPRMSPHRAEGAISASHLQTDVVPRCAPFGVPLATFVVHTRSSALLPAAPRPTFVALQTVATTATAGDTAAAAQVLSVASPGQSARSPASSAAQPVGTSILPAAVAALRVLQCLPRADPQGSACTDPFVQPRQQGLVMVAMVAEMAAVTVAVLAAAPRIQQNRAVWLR